MPGRESNCRQGDVLSARTAAALGLVQGTESGRRVVVITHDCDLLHEGEEFVEIIVAEEAVEPDPMLSHAKNPRRLHLIYEGTGGARLVLGLRHVERRCVPRQAFLESARRDESLALPAEAKRALKQWLAARYGRPAFPEAFEARLRMRQGKRSVEKQIGKILEPESKHLVGLLFDLGEQRGVEAAPGDPYALSISVIYDAIEGGSEAREAAEVVAEKLRELFEGAYGRASQATVIALDACEAVADTHVTLADLRRMDQWRLEYISLRDGDEDDFLPVGEMPA